INNRAHPGSQTPLSPNHLDAARRWHPREGSAPCVASHSFNLQNSAVSRIPVRDAVQSEKLLRNPSHVSSYHPSVHLRPIAVLLTPKEKPDINRLQQTCAVIAPHFRIRFSLGEFMKTKNVIAVVLFALVTGCFAQSSSPEAHRSNA